MASSRSLPELAHVISSCTNRIYDAYDDEGIPQPSFDVGADHFSGPFTPAVETSRVKLLEALDELRALIIGPAGHVFFLSFLMPAHTATLHTLYKFEIAKHVPLGEAISYADLASRCGLSESSTRRRVRAAISLRIFHETPAGLVQHNAASLALGTTTLHDWLGMATEEIAPAALKIAESMEKYPACDDPTKSPFSLAHNGNGEKDLFGIVSDQPARMERFAKAIAWSMKVPGMEPRYTVDNLGWESNCPKVVVDVGGGMGDLCKAMLDKYPGIETAIIEDLPEVAAQGEKAVPPEYNGRLSFQPYSFFTEQVVKDADVYVWRCVLHDWPDSYADTILRNQIPALKPGARLIFNERCLAAPKACDHVQEQFARACDTHMQSCANAKERTYDDWVSLFAKADPRFRLQSVTTPLHSALSIIEVVWMGDSKQPGHLDIHSQAPVEEAPIDDTSIDQTSVGHSSVDDAPKDYFMAPDEYETSTDGSELSYVPEKAVVVHCGTSKPENGCHEVRIADPSRVSQHWLSDDEGD
ncbi:sterigmatocystin 8-O-methyltransferase precursor [Apiospora hydei]|uniref:Sterigmatocystin 8-O-methyltransferase n=1 Tax=Apiospora hydei TaxID=1337664 RepID=A0ABR1V3Z6_9PEZI